MKRAVKDKVTEARLKKYIKITEVALGSISINSGNSSHLYRTAHDVRGMVEAYLSDAKRFHEKGEFVDAFACVNYAHGWLDAGARIGIYKVIKNRELFTVE
jgi:hypothetical protein